MNISDKIEKIIAEEHGYTWQPAGKSIGDFWLSEHEPVDVKSNNVNKNNFSPNLVSAMKMWKFIEQNDKQLYFVFVDYELKNRTEINIIDESDFIPVHYLDWDCLSIQCQGLGVIQYKHPIKMTPQTEEEWKEKFKERYAAYIEKERTKLIEIENVIGLKK